MRIYIAGPYCPVDCDLHDAARIADRNVKKAISKFHELRALGHEPFVPHLSHYIHIQAPEDYGYWWVEYDMTFLEHWAEAIYMLKGWDDSKGSCQELNRAIELKLKVIYEDFE